MSIAVPHEPSQVNLVESTSAVPLMSPVSPYSTSSSHRPLPEIISSNLLKDRRSLHSLGARKPLRSSPLAGPALQADQTAAEAKEKTSSRPSRITSTPDLVSLLAPPPPSRRTRPRTTESALEILPLSSPHPATQGALQGSTASYTFPSGNSTKQTGADLGRLASLAPSSLITSPPPALCSPSKAGFEDLPNFPVATRRPNTTDGYPTTPSSLLGSNKSSAKHTSSVHRDSGDNSWLIANTYETTPKFTRLGLASPGVVLPVSAKDHKRVVDRNSKSSVKTSTARLSRAGSTNFPSDASPSSSLQQDTLSLPGPSLTRCNSSEATSVPLYSLQPREDNVATVISSSIATDPEGEAHDLQYHSTSKSDNYASSVPINVTSRKGPLARFKDLTLRTFKSSPSLTKSHSTPISGKLTTTEVDIRLQSEIKFGFFTTRSGSPTASESTADTKTAEVGILPSTDSKSSLNTWASWKSLTFWHRSA